MVSGKNDERWAYKKTRAASSLNLYVGIGLNHPYDPVPSDINTIAHDESKTHRRHDTFSLLCLLARLAIPDALTVRWHTRGRSTTTSGGGNNASSCMAAFRASRRWEECQDVHMHAGLAATTTAARAGEVDHTCLKTSLCLTSAPLRYRIQSRQRAVLSGWRWSLLDSVYRHFAIQRGCQARILGKLIMLVVDRWARP